MPAALTDDEGRIVCGRCAIADTPWTRLRGLLGRRGLELDEGLLIRPTNGVHTMFMRFPIDAVFLDRELVVVRVVANLQPWRMAIHRGARVVLELPSGAAARAGIKLGKRLSLAG
jgi:uncharacterized membrane protein (UPF0127 family)